MPLTAEQIIHELALSPHPEGGFFAETFRSACSVESPAHGRARASLC